MDERDGLRAAADEVRDTWAETGDKLEESGEVPLLPVWLGSRIDEGRTRFLRIGRPR
jgi:hypothetical protein